MNTVEHLRELFIYNDWANRRIINSLGENQSVKSLKIFAHSLVTEQEYFERLSGKDSTGFDFWQNLSLVECEKLGRKIAENYNDFLRGLNEANLDVNAEYKTSEGVSRTNTLRELLTHVLFHSSTHRGNIIIKLREERFVPPKIDYIIYLRETKNF